MKNTKNFSNPKQLRPKTNASFLLALCLFSIFIGVTLAFFFADNFATKDITLTGAVRIEAVGPGPTHSSIEDTVSESKLIITLEDNYDVLIPNMKINMPAYCKVFRSTTKPLLRALFNMNVYEADLTTELEDSTISSSLFSQIADKIEANGWHLHTDGYYYYVGEIEQDEDKLLGNSVIQEVDATQAHNIVPFIKEDDDMVFPKDIDSSYSGMGVQITITFQAIQNYIPDDNGEKLPNTITNSLKLFNYIESSKLAPTPLEYFNVTTVGGKTTLSLNPETIALLPEVVVLPSTDSEGNSITALDTTFAGNCGNVTKLIVPSTYTKIAEGAFRSTTIQNVDLSKTTITEIPKDCFSNSNIKTVNLPSTLTTIGANAFYLSSLSSIVVPEGVTTLAETSLWNTKLKTLYISSTVENIIGQCINSTSLIKITVHEDNRYFYDIDNTHLVGIDGKLHAAVINLPEEYKIPDDVTHLTNYVFTSCRYLKIINLNNVTYIGDGALPNGLKGFVIPEHNTAYYTSVGYDLIQKSNRSVLKLCLQDTKIDYVIPDDVLMLNTDAITDIPIGTLTIGKSLEYTNAQGNYVDFFEVHPENKKYLTNGKVLYTADTIIMYSRTCADVEYTVPSGITRIFYMAFNKNSNLQTVNLPDGLLTIEYGAFWYCPNLKNIVIPNTVTAIKQFPFAFTAIESITLYGALSPQVMEDANKLKTVVIDESVNRLRANSFRRCTSLEWIEFKNTTPPTIDTANMFSGASSDWVIYVPDSAVATYKAVEQLVPYADRIYPVSERP